MDINNFGSLNSDIWGNISDWVMVIVTSITGALIWLTLRSQNKVQALQQHSTLIENEKYRNEVLPVFAMRLAEKRIRKIKDDIVLDIFIDFHLKENDCQRLKINCDTLVSDVISFEIISGMELDYLHRNAHRIAHLVIRDKKEKFDSLGGNFNVNFTFEDIINNKYSQDIFVSLSYTESIINEMEPLRVFNRSPSSLLVGIRPRFRWLRTSIKTCLKFIASSWK